MTAATVTLGKLTPRLWPRPLVEGGPGPCPCGGCALTESTSLGFSVAAFAELVGHPLLGWQQVLVVHAMELRPDGLPRFRTVLALVARQQGKSSLLKVLAGWWLLVQRVPLVLGLSAKLDTAAEAWAGALRLIQDQPDLAELVADVRRANGQECITTVDGARYRIAAANDDAGRGLTVHRLIMDELRQQRSWDAWSAAVKATTAVPDAQVWCISNAGDDRSIVLNSLRKRAKDQLDSGDAGQVGLFEWSAPDGCALDDPEAWAQANPSLGRGLTTADTLAAALLTDPEAVFRTEVLCQQAKTMDPAIEPRAWLACLDIGTLDDVRSRVACCVDVSLDAQHATLMAAALLPDGRVRVEPVTSWSGPGCTVAMARELPGFVARVKPRVVGWFPGGPAASVAVDLKRRKGWPPRGVRVEGITVEVAAVCMGFEAAVKAGAVAHSADPLLDAHVAVAEPLRSGDRWVFGRRGAAGHVDAVYAAAGAAHLARSLPVAVRGSGRVVTAGGQPVGER